MNFVHPKNSLMQTVLNIAQDVVKILLLVKVDYTSSLDYSHQFLCKLLSK